MAAAPALLSSKVTGAIDLTPRDAFKFEPILPGLAVARWVPEPVLITQADLLCDGKRYYMRLADRQGRSQTVICNPKIRHSADIFNELLAPMCVGADIRDIENLVDQWYRADRNYKLAGGLSFWQCIGNIELAALGLLAKIAGIPVWRFFVEKKIRDEFGVYYSSFDRKNSAEHYVADVQKVVETHGFRCVKLKIGGRMSRNADCLPGRTEALIPLARKTFGDDFTLYVDCNGSYDDPREALRILRICEDYGVAIAEEPAPFLDFEATRQVAQGCSIPIAGGEQDNSLHLFKYYAESGVLRVLQPDFEYVGGFLRLLQVARIAAHYGLELGPHHPKRGSARAYLNHLAAIVPNLCAFQESRLFENWEGDPPDFLRQRQSRMRVPDAPGWGWEEDPKLLIGAVKI